MIDVVVTGQTLEYCAACPWDDAPVLFGGDIAFHSVSLACASLAIAAAQLDIRTAAAVARATYAKTVLSKPPSTSLITGRID